MENTTWEKLALESIEVISAIDAGHPLIEKLKAKIADDYEGLPPVPASVDRHVGNVKALIMLLSANSTVNPDKDFLYTLRTGNNSLEQIRQSFRRASDYRSTDRHNALVVQYARLREAARRFYNATIADTSVIIRCPSETKMNEVVAVSETLRNTLQATYTPDVATPSHYSRQDIIHLLQKLGYNDQCCHELADWVLRHIQLAFNKGVSVIHGPRRGTVISEVELTEFLEAITSSIANAEVRGQVYSNGIARIRERKLKAI